MDVPRGSRVHDALESLPDIRLILRAIPEVIVCVGPGLASGVTPEGVVLIPSAMSDNQALARAAHLVHHLRPGSPLLEARPEHCPQWIDHALDEEALAYATELRILDNPLGAPSLPFASAALQAPSGHEREVIRLWLDDHPDGDDAIPPLATTYRMRCTR